MARISIFGIGYVGVVSAACLAKDGHEVVAVDVDPVKVENINAGKSPIVENGLDALIAAGVASGRLRATLDAREAVLGTDASFVCVGTPSAPDGSVGLTYVVSACEAIAAALKEKDGFHSVVIRSTIVPGSTEGVCIPVLERISGGIAGKDFGVGYYPEFLRESTAIEDNYDPGLIVFGHLDAPTGAILTELNADLPCEIHKVDLRTAEMVKYTSNTWRAVKVTYANEIGNIAKACGLDGQTVMKILCSDSKINISSYFMRPGFAFGGSCLPKDVRALRALAHDKGVVPHLMDAVLEANAEQIARAERMVRQSGARRVGMVGISFKPGTDDMRESPLAELAARLIGEGIDVSVYDPYVHTALTEEMSAIGRTDRKVPDLASRMVGEIGELIAGSEAIIVGNLYDEARAPLTAASEATVMVDLTRLDPARTSSGAYSGICW
ncbi:nucleotide sugar dehydrogenase [Tropicimonas sediminicola]|uniref:UDP-glucose 6-dehydrogenase n=1 Tax=Tropicimonas sediminicola TaxID=1031541 RepID=A0A239ML03_9RHOB|nr:nucleotide sugar dehydrogenase [Tropicimonas sediminicola]SNT42812.1 GDP-mannose 6-dehydrogenase [Tropicimonas sediminicola]